MNYTRNELSNLGVECDESVKIDNTVKFYGSGPFQFASKVRIDAYSVITGNVIIGKMVHIGTGCILQGSHGIILEDYCGFSSRVVVYTATDDYKEGYLAGPTMPYEVRKIFSRSVRICRGAVVGTTAVILPGVVVGEGASVGALSLVKKDIFPFTINAGTPTKIVGMRDAEMLRKNMSKLDELN